MFAHQVIEDLKTQVSRIKLLKKNDPIKAMQMFGDQDNLFEIAGMDMIPRAQKFHFDDGEALLNMTKVKTPFKCDGTSIKMPYETMWFDFDSNKDSAWRYGCLVQHYGDKELDWDDEYELFCFEYVREHKMWSMVPILSFIKDGGFEIYRDDTSDFMKNKYPDLMDKMLALMSYCVFLAHNAILLLNCKNIQTETIKAPEALNRKRRKAGKQELFDYHVLNVVVPSRKRDYSEKTEPLSHNRVHLCRGHFKEYTKEHPLFGKLTGLYWWQPHVRGQNKDGVVMKDYNVKVN